MIREWATRVGAELRRSWDGQGSRSRAVVIGATLILCGLLSNLGEATIPARVFLGCPGDFQCGKVAALERGDAFGEALHLLDRHGRALAHVAGIARLSVPIDRMPAVLREGYVAVEDRRFWRHGGVDEIALWRAGIRDMISRDIVSGASTIPMQLARTLWAEELQGTNRWIRKLKELWIAPRLVHRLGKKGVLEAYLNSVYLGDGVYGVPAAALHYFATPVDSLTLDQIATLIGLTRSPEGFDPRERPEQSRARRDLVLEVLAKRGVIEEREATEAAKQPLMASETSGFVRTRGYVTAAITRELRRVAPELAGLPGLIIRTTIDPEVQAAGEAAIADNLRAIERGERGLFVGQGVLQAAGVAIDPTSGAIRGLIGGRDFSESELDRATQSVRPIGSLVKPFLLAAALERGFQLSDRVSTGPISVAIQGEQWSPADHVEESEVALIDMLALSSNHAAVRIGAHLGNEALREESERLGLDATVPPYPSAFLGAFDASPIDVLSAYAPFANGGATVEPFLIESIASRDGDVLYWHDVRPPDDRRVLARRHSFLVLQAMKRVVDAGTAWRVGTAYGGPAAGKTGTSDGGHDAWFVGFTPELGAAVWVGFDMPAPMVQGGAGGSLAAPAWASWMQPLASPDSFADWTPPADVALVAIDTRSGVAFGRDCEVRNPYRLIYVTKDAAPPSCVAPRPRTASDVPGLGLRRRGVPSPVPLSLRRGRR